MALFSPFWNGAMFFAFCCIVSFLMFLAGGMVIDKVHDAALDADLLHGAAEQNDYEKGSEPTMNLLINMYYGIMYALPVFGAIVWAQAIYKREPESRYYGGYQ